MALSSPVFDPLVTVCTESFFYRRLGHNAVLGMELLEEVNVVVLSGLAYENKIAWRAGMKAYRFHPSVNHPLHTGHDSLACPPVAVSCSSLQNTPLLARLALQGVQFDALGRFPLVCLSLMRGALEDILGRDSVEGLRAREPLFPFEVALVGGALVVICPFMADLSWVRENMARGEKGRALVGKAVSASVRVLVAPETQKLSGHERISLHKNIWARGLRLTNFVSFRYGLALALAPTWTDIGVK